MRVLIAIFKQAIAWLVNHTDHHTNMRTQPTQIHPRTPALWCGTGWHNPDKAFLLREKPSERINGRDSS